MPVPDRSCCPLGTLPRSVLTEFQADLVEIYSAKHLCPQYEQRATVNLRSSILGGR